MGAEYFTADLRLSPPVSTWKLLPVLDFLSYSKIVTHYLDSLEGENPRLWFLFSFSFSFFFTGVGIDLCLCCRGVCSLKRPTDVAELIKQIGQRTRPQSLWIMKEVARLKAPLHQIWNALLTRCVIYFNQIIFYGTRRRLKLSKRERWRFCGGVVLGIVFWNWMWRPGTMTWFYMHAFIMRPRQMVSYG